MIWIDSNTVYLKLSPSSYGEELIQFDTRLVGVSIRRWSATASVKWLGEGPDDIRFNGESSIKWTGANLSKWAGETLVVWTGDSMTHWVGVESRNWTAVASKCGEED